MNYVGVAEDWDSQARVMLDWLDAQNKLKDACAEKFSYIEKQVKETWKEEKVTLVEDISWLDMRFPWEKPVSWLRPFARIRWNKCIKSIMRLETDLGIFRHYGKISSKRGPG